jgi:flagellar biosynthesis/type III secretory pathway protein FliH
VLDEFVPLDEFLRPPATEPAMPSSPETSADPVVPVDCAEAMRAARRFRAALADAIDLALQQMLPEIARELVARELQLGRADVAVIVANAMERFSQERVLSLRAHPSELEALATLEIPSVADPSLQPGDVILELHSGTIDLRMEARLEAILSACAPC